jgi:hypothetical protein
VAPAANFEALAADLMRFHRSGLLSGGSGQPVTFDEAGARAQGFSPAAIALGAQSAAHSNEIVAALVAAERAGAAAGAGAEDGVGGTAPGLDARRYPALAAFQAAAASRVAGGAAPAPAAEGSPEAEATPQGIPGLSHAVCGYYPNPKPRAAAPWNTYTRTDPAATLRGLGYHPTPTLIGGGWTRPQTYQPLLCGWGTYRDHALITGPSTLREQNYKSSPGGEPNPEVYRTGPWPYPDWPAYVYWWHRTR